MYDVYARSFLEATRFTQNTRPAPRTEQQLGRANVPATKPTRQKRALRFWI